MQIARYLYRSGVWNASEKNDPVNPQQVQLVLAFGAKELLVGSEIYDELKNMFPQADIALSSTAGEIFGVGVYEDTVTAVAIQFKSTPVKCHAITIKPEENSYDAGIRLLQSIDTEGLSGLFILSDGAKVNGSELTKALNTITVAGIPVSGGLAGDGNRFHSTLTGLNGPAEEGIIVGIGLYGQAIKIGYGSAGGWETFGLEKTVTRSQTNVLYEIDNNNALEIYKKYLGPEADLLPGSALLFPLSVTLPDTGEQVVRTILSINPDEGSMTFAGDIPTGAGVRFMRANLDRITLAAAEAARQTMSVQKNIPKLSVLVSCVGRKLMLKERAEEGPEAINEVYGGDTHIVGFYSYGEISPIVKDGPCSLHNQTMTITTFYETE